MIWSSSALAEDRTLMGSRANGKDYLGDNSPVLTVVRALARDRAVDESGNQLSVFGRVGSRPLNLEEQRRLYLRDGKVYTVTNDPPEKR